MVLSSLINPAKAEKHPYEFILFGFIYASLGISLSLWIFKEETSLVMLILTVMAAAPFMINLLKLEEKKDTLLDEPMTMLKEHVRAINVYASLFIGFTFSFAVWYLLLPNSLLHTVFRVQTSTLIEITGGAVMHSDTYYFFSKIFLNNIKVFVFCILFSFIYGLGALFVITWNASVLGVAMGDLIKKFIMAAAPAGGGLLLYFKGFGLSFIRYFIHGIPEILAYLIGGIAGGIISAAIANHDFNTKNFQKVLFDSANLILAGILILLIAAILEAWVTPAIFSKIAW